MNVIIRGVVGEDRDVFDRWAAHVKATNRTQRAALIELMRLELQSIGEVMRAPDHTRGVSDA